MQVQPPHWQLVEQVWVPLVSQAWVALGAHTPVPVHVPHADQVPLLQVRDWVPQFPQASVFEPVQVQAPATQVEPPGQTLPQVPQLLGSVCRSTQVLVQRE